MFVLRFFILKGFKNLELETFLTTWFMLDRNCFVLLSVSNQKVLCHSFITLYTQGAFQMYFMIHSGLCVFCREERTPILFHTRIHACVHCRLHCCRMLSPQNQAAGLLLLLQIHFLWRLLTAPAELSALPSASDFIDSYPQKTPRDDEEDQPGPGTSIWGRFGGKRRDDSSDLLPPASFGDFRWNWPLVQAAVLWERFSDFMWQMYLGVRPQCRSLGSAPETLVRKSNNYQESTSATSTLRSIGVLMCYWLVGILRDAYITGMACGGERSTFSFSILRT